MTNPNLGLMVRTRFSFITKMNRFLVFDDKDMLHLHHILKNRVFVNRKTNPLKIHQSYISLLFIKILKISEMNQ